MEAGQEKVNTGDDDPMQSCFLEYRNSTFLSHSPSSLPSSPMFAQAGISQCPGSGSFLEITEQKDALVVADLPQTASNTCVSPFLQDWSFNAEVECNIVCGDDSIGKTQSDKASSNYLDESVNTEQVPCQLVEARDWAQSGCGGSGDGKSCKGRHANGEGLMNMVSSVYDTKQDLDNENLPKEKSPTKLNDQKRRRVWPFTTSMSSNTETVNFGSNMNDVQVNQSSVCSYRDGSNAEAVRDPSIFHCGIHALDKVRKKDCVSKDNSISDMGDVLCRGMQHRRSSELLNQQSPFPSASETTMNDKAPWGDIKVQNSIPELKRLSPASKNISSERRRRLKLNEKLYCLRALVPSISKMDKASILADAVQYVRELKQKVDNMEEEIASLEEYKMKIVRTPQRHHAAMDGSRKRYAQFSTKSRNLAHHIVHELDVEKMNDALFYIQIHCMKSSGVLLQLARAIEALDVKIVNASSMSKNDHLINTLMIEVHAKRGLDVGDVQRAVITSFAKFGIFFMESSFRSKCSKKESTEIQAFCT